MLVLELLFYNSSVLEQCFNSVKYACSTTVLEQCSRTNQAISRTCFYSKSVLEIV